MNNTRRDEILAVQALLDQAFMAFDNAKVRLADVLAEEEEAFQSASEGRQNGDWGQESQAVTEAIQTLIDAIDSCNLSEEVRELADAADRSLSAPEGKLSKAEAEQRRWDRLPQWAKNALKRAEEAKDAAEKKQQAGLKDWVEGTKRPMFDAYHGPLVGKEVPCDRIKFPQCGITVSYDDYSKSVEIKGDGFSGGVTIRSNASNVFFAKTEKWG